MKHAHTDDARTRITSVIAVVLLILGGAVQASARQNTGSASPQQAAGGARDRAKPSITFGSTLFATWGTVTNGNSSANAAEHRKESTGAHAGSANAAEAPAFSAYPH